MEVCMMSDLIIDTGVVVVVFCCLTKVTLYPTKLMFINIFMRHDLVLFDGQTVPLCRLLFLVEFVPQLSLPVSRIQSPRSQVDPHQAPLEPQL
jgi:hypothetical protein